MPVEPPENVAREDRPRSTGMLRTGPPPGNVAHRELSGYREMLRFLEVTDGRQAGIRASAGAVGRRRGEECCAKMLRRRGFLDATSVLVMVWDIRSAGKNVALPCRTTSSPGHRAGGKPLPGGRGSEGGLAGAVGSGALLVLAGEDGLGPFLDKVYSMLAGGAG
jgi:hypothetical protein